MKLHNYKVLNSDGQEVVLNAQERYRAQALEQVIKNATGMEVDITTLTTIMKKISEQKFFQIAFADYMPVNVGEGAWSSFLTTYRSFVLGGGFGTGIVDTGASNGRLAKTDAAVDAISVPVIKWAKSIGWNLMEINEAITAGNWDLITALEESRKTEWDLGLQEVAFIGLPQQGLTGLLTLPGITSNTALITKQISSMTGAELKDFTRQVLGAYRTNCARTAMPTDFTIPEDDFLGLASASSPDFPIKSVKQVLEETFVEMTGNKGFKIRPCAYADSIGDVVGGVAKRYALYNSDEKSLRMDIPVDYTNTLANSTDNFNFQNVGYGTFSGVNAYRPKEILYFDY